MSLIVLDTNVVSELAKPAPDPAVIAWARSLPPPSNGITSVSVMEVRRGVLRLPDGRRKRELAARLDAFIRVAVGEVLDFDTAAAEETAAYLVERERAGRPLADMADAMIAGIVLRLNNRDGRPATLATRNVGDFLGVPCVDPWRP